MFSQGHHLYYTSKHLLFLRYQCCVLLSNVMYILEYNPHHFDSLSGLKNQLRITIASGLDSRSRAGFWENDGAAVRAVRTIQYNN
jgi:hypothetical protein